MSDDYEDDFIEIDDSDFESYDPPATEDETLLTIAEAMKTFNVSRSTLYQWRKQGILPAYKLGLGNSVRYKKSEIDRLLNQANQLKRI